MTRGTYGSAAGRCQRNARLITAEAVCNNGKDYQAADNDDKNDGNGWVAAVWVSDRLTQLIIFVDSDQEYTLGDKPVEYAGKNEERDTVYIW